MINGVLINSEEVVRPLSISSLEGLKALCREGLNGGERNLLLKQVENKFENEYGLKKEAQDRLFDLILEEDQEGEEVTEEEWDEWERRKALSTWAIKRWRGVAGEWVDAIHEAHYPRCRGVSLVIDVPYPPDLGEDGNWRDRKARREWRGMAKGRVREAKEALKQGSPLPKWALKIPLTYNKEARARGVEAYVSYTETRALEETLCALEGWEASEGRAGERLREAVTQELSGR